MSVNDCLCTGGEPLLFLDYLAMPKDDPPLTRALIRGISDGCIDADCALVGGETAILPDFYHPGDFDMAGFCVGVVEREHIINGKNIQPGDVVLGLASSGLHSNGYSLVRKVVFDHAGLTVDQFVPSSAAPWVKLCSSRRGFTCGRSNRILQHYPVKETCGARASHITAAGWSTMSRACCRPTGEFS